MSSFSSRFMPAIGSSRSSSSGSIASARPELDALLQTVGQLADRHLADVLDLEEVDDVLDDAPMLDLLAQRRAVAQELPEEAAPHLQAAARHDVVEGRHALEQGDVLERARDAAAGRLRRPHLAARHRP